MLSLGHPRACGLFRGPRRRAAFERRVEGGAASHRRAWQRAVAQGVAGGAEAEAAGSAAQQASPSSSVSEPNGSTAAPPPPSDEQPSAAAAERQPPQPQPQQQPWLSPAALRKVSAAGDANEAVDLLLAELGGVAAAGLSEAHCRELLAACLERGNVPLAQSIYAAMTAAGSGAAASATASFDGGSWGGGAGFWPPATIDTATALVVGLAQALHTREAIGVINAVRSRGLRTAEDVHFGYVVACPGPAGAGKPLTVMQPQEGAKLVADAYSRYEYEVFSGTATEATSESLVSKGQGLLAAAARAAGLLRSPPAGAVHTLVVQTPGGQQRSFRFSTVTADLPAKVGDRVSLVCAPSERGLFSRRRIISASPPGTKPGEALSLTNHTTGQSTQLQRPAATGAPAGLPPWLLPATAVLVASDAATSLISPTLPYLAAGAFAATVATGVAANAVVLPRLKMLPERAVEVQATRQRLLKQHAALEARIAELVGGAVEDVRMLARMWQLSSKMAAVGAEGAYETRLDRVAAARANLEQRLQKRVELVDAYARVAAMIEIEVEMETQLPAAEVAGIEEQVARLAELEGLQEEWRAQAEAQDEVERLLRSTQGA